MGEGNMYCEKCGEEIHIVPDFEPEIENSISDVLSNVAEEIEPTPVSQDTIGNITIDLSGDTKDISRQAMDDGILVSKKLLISVFGILVSIIIVLISVIVVYVSHDNSSGYQMDKADELYEAGKYSDAIDYYEKAYRLNSDDYWPLYKLADCYYALGDKDSAIDSYETIIIKDNTEEEAWMEVINLLDEDKNYKEINSLLTNYATEKINAEFIEYIAKTPGFSLEDGKYDEVVELKLIPSVEGSIYYTLDGSEPGSDCLLYTEPIVLRNGHYIINAMFVNEYGVCSDVVSHIYDVETDAPSIPVVSLDEGNYNVPQLINIIVPEGSDVYYTTDGSAPGQTSAIYTEPIAIPVGESLYRFVAISKSGNKSEEVTRHYNLEVQVTVSEEEALNIINRRQFELGRVIDESGTVDEKGKYMYSVSEMRYIHNRTMYFISEYYQEGTIRMVTGNVFAVDVYDGTTYQAVLEKDNTYSLYSF